MKTLEEIIDQMHKHDMFVVEIKTGKFLMIKCPPDVELLRTMENIFIMHDRRETRHDITHVNSSPGDNYSARLYSLGQYDRETFKSFLIMLQMLKPGDLMKELRINEPDDETEKYKQEMEDLMMDVMGEDYIPDTEIYDVFRDDNSDSEESEDLYADDDYFDNYEDYDDEEDYY